MQKRREIAGNAPWFALYQKTKGELDFYVRSLVDYLYLLKGDTKGGTSRDGKVSTVPLYLADRMKSHPHISRVIPPHPSAIQKRNSTLARRGTPMKKACGRNSIKGLMAGSFGKRKIPMEIWLLSCYNVFRNLRQKTV